MMTGWHLGMMLMVTRKSGCPLHSGNGNHHAGWGRLWRLYSQDAAGDGRPDNSKQRDELKEHIRGQWGYISTAAVASLVLKQGEQGTVRPVCHSIKSRHEQRAWEERVDYLKSVCHGSFSTAVPHHYK